MTRRRVAHRGPPAGALILAAATAAAAQQPADTSQLARGRQVVETVCAACHTVAPPAKNAPPFRMIAMHYRRQAGDSAAAVERITKWIAEPAAERSLLPAMVRQRWGVMPPLPIPEDQRRAAATYVLSLRGMRMGMGMRMP